MCAHLMLLSGSKTCRIVTITLKTQQKQRALHTNTSHEHFTRALHTSTSHEHFVRPCSHHDLKYKIKVKFVRYEVFTAVTMRNAVFWDVTPCGSFTDRRFGGTYRLHCQGGTNQRARNNVSSNKQPTIVFLRSVRRLLVTANVVPSSPILVTLMNEAIRSSETSVSQESLGVSSQKTKFFIVAAVKTSNPT
jgi:hypothetical protein